jgi:hypothetical protein
MNARNELAGILEQWLQLTGKESAAIQSAAWPALKRIQARKTALRQSFAAAAQKCAREDASAAQALTPQAARIVSLLTRNGEALAAQLRKVRARQEVLNQAKRNLSRIKRSYLRPQHSTAWHSYS